MSNTASSLAVDRAMVERSFRLFAAPEGVTELRVITGVPRFGTISGYFDDPELFTDAACQHAFDGPATLMLLNPGKPELLCRRVNRINFRVKHTTSAHDILRRNRFLVDCDSVRPVSDISATESEHDFALERMCQIAYVLSQQSWTPPAEADSGNGGHLVFHVDLPNDPDSEKLLKAALQALAARFNDEHVQVDTQVFNADRLTKVYGTPARKGDHTPDRPHRLSRLLKVPDSLGLVTREQIEELARSITPAVRVNGVGPGAGRAPQTDPKTIPAGTKNKSKFKIDDFMARNFPDAHEPEAYRGGRIWKLRQCPFDPDHGDKDAAVFEGVDGALGFHCFHASCAGYAWKNLRALFSGTEPLPALPGESRAGVSSEAVVIPISGDGGQADLLGYSLTDYGNAQRLIAFCGQNLRYCHLMKSWFAWDGRRWQRDSTATARRLAKNTILEFLRQAAEGDRRALIKFALASLDQRDLTRMLASAQDHIYLEPREMDTHPFLLNCRNGTVDLETGTLRPHAREDYLTKLVDHDYDPQAQCPRWRQFLREILTKYLPPTKGSPPAEDLLRYVQRALGYSLTADTSERVVFISYGSGNNGKTTLLGTFHGLIAEYAVVINPDSLMNQKYPSNNAQADLADLFGARFVRTSECEAGSVLSQARLKAMTQGHGGRIRACRKYENPFDFPETHKLWIDTNPKPQIRDVDDNATFNRLHPIPFTVVIPEDKIDPKLGALLEAELEGILAWAVKGALEWRKEGLGRPSMVEAAVREWRNENDNIARFVDECCETGAYFSEAAGELYRRYRLWCEKNKEWIQRNQNFSASLQRRGYERTEGKRGNKYSGLKLIPLSDEQDGDPHNNEVPF